MKQLNRVKDSAQIEETQAKARAESLRSENDYVME